MSNIWRRIGFVHRKPRPYEQIRVARAVHCVGITMKTALLSLALVASAAGLAHADPEDAAGLFSGCSESESDMTTGCGTDASTGEPTLSCDVSGTRKHGSSLPTFGVFAFVGLAIARKRRRSRA